MVNAEDATVAAARTRSDEAAVAATVLAGDAAAAATISADAAARTDVAAALAGTMADAGASPELGPGACVGRFVVLGRLGAGAMGVVYAAHDPELDRKLALKLLRPGGGDADAGARMLREAQALARLAHPNVVAVHDTGTHAGRVWIAMEFVAGQTLTAWARARARRWPEVLRALEQAARGVAAAHAASLVHRDLKADNVMVGDDGRVRVMDFGLAHGRQAARVGESLALSQRITRVGAIQGTPATMAPEQWIGAEVGPPADQFAWCVTAWELLYGEPPFPRDSLPALARAVCSGQRRAPPRGRRIPAWLRRVLERGLAVQQAARWPDMGGLLAAIERGRRGARARVVVLAALGLVVGVAAGALVHRWDERRQMDACARSGGTLDELWQGEPRERVRAGLLASGVLNAAGTAERVTPWLDRHAEAWRGARAAVCEASRSGTWDADTVDRAMWCLDERRAPFAALLAALERPGPQAVQAAVPAAAALRDPAACLDEGALHRLPPVPADERAAVREVQAELSAAQGRALAGDAAGALAQVTAARARADALGWPPLIAAARLREGTLADATGEYAAAEVALESAYFTATRADAWETAADAASELVLVVGFRLARHAEGRAWGEHAAMASDRAGDPGRVREVVEVERLAVVDLDAGDFAAARAGLERAREIQREVFGEDHPFYATTLNRLGAVALRFGDADEARRLFERSREIRERVLGPDHPQLAAVLTNLGNVMFTRHEYAAALGFYERALAIEERALGPGHPNIGHGLVNLGSAHHHLDHEDQALALTTRGLAIYEASFGPEHPVVATAVANLGDIQLARGEPDAARPLIERALTLRERSLGPDHPDVALSLQQRAKLALRTGDLPTAEAALERAREIVAAVRGAELVDAAELESLTAEARRRGGRVGEGE